MPDRISWLFAFLAFYSVYCLYWGATSSRGLKNSESFFLADREIPAWVFVLIGTALSLSGWVFMGHPSMIFMDGFQYAQCAVAVVVIPLAGILFLKRQWMLGKRFGFVTPGELFAEYYSGESIRVVVVLISLVFAIPFVGVQLSLSGSFISSLSNGKIDHNAAMWILSFNLFLYICMGGMRAVTRAGVLQSLLMVAGMVAVSCIAYIQLGGFGAFNKALARLGASSQVYTDDFFIIPGVIQFTKGIGKEMPFGGVWTASMILTYGFALMGIQASPAFSILGFSCRDSKGFAVQQVWALGGVIGIILLFFAVIQGMGAHFLGASKEITDAGLALSDVLPKAGGAQYTNVTIAYIKSIAAENPWFMALFAICGLAAIQVVAGAYVWTTATILTIDVYKRFVHPTADERVLRLCARITVTLIFFTALLMATFNPAAQAYLGMMALAFAVQLWPTLAGVCWLPWITRQGATLGLIAGLMGVFFTDPIGGSFTRLFGVELPWGSWPWTIYSAGWGVFCNVVICLVVSLATRGGEDRRRRMMFHQFLQENAGQTKKSRAIRLAVWASFLTWLFFGIGPGVIIGNHLFGSPDGGIAAWRLGIPSLWGWQIIWWALGILVIWWLAYKMELSVLPLEKSVRTGKGYEFERRGRGRTPLWIRNFLDRIR